MILFILLLWLIPIAANVYIDRNGKKPEYMQVFVLRGMAAIIHGILTDMVCHIFPNDLYRYSMWELVLIYLPLLVFQVTSFWILFEISLNVVRGRELLYFDRKERDSGWIDKLFDRLGNGAHLAAKLMALVFCIISIIVIYHS